MISFKSFRSSRYPRLPSENENPAAIEKQICTLDPSTKSTRWFPFCFLLTMIAIVGLGGFGWGVYIAQDINRIPEWTHSLRRVEISWKQQTFVYNKTFGLEPSEDQSTEEAWDAIVPQGQGFVRYPANSPNVSAVSAVHQLHCLYSIRRAYFSAASSHHGGEMYHEPSHMRHCFDYLRQSLMCSADSSLEPQHPTLPGVTGWGFPRRCQNYEELKSWAEHWRSNDRGGFREGHFPSHPSLDDRHHS